jgi:hypothetical protein
MNKKQDVDVRQASQVQHRMFEYQIKKTAAFSAINIRLPNLLIHLEISPETLVLELQTALQRQIEAIRPGRAFPRKKLTPTQRLNYHLYRKKRC